MAAVDPLRIKPSTVSGSLHNPNRLRRAYSSSGVYSLCGVVHAQPDRTMNRLRLRSGADGIAGMINQHRPTFTPAEFTSRWSHNTNSSPMAARNCWADCSPHRVGAPCRSQISLIPGPVIPASRMRSPLSSMVSALITVARPEISAIGGCGRDASTCKTVMRAMSVGEIMPDESHV